MAGGSAAAGYASLILMVVAAKRSRVVTKRGVEAGYGRFCLCYVPGISMTTTFRRTPGQIHAAHFAIPAASDTVLLFIVRFAPLDGTNRTS